MDNPFLSFCLPAFNEEKLLPISLSNINNIRRELLLKGISSELIVCDNNSTDRTAEIARSLDAELVFEPVNRIASARNAAASKAEGVWLVFVDADTFPNLPLIEDMLSQIQTRKIMGGGSVIRMEGISFHAKVLVWIWNLISRLFHFSAGSFVFIDRQAFNELTGFNSQMFAAEEIDFSRRAKALAKRQDLKWKILTRNPILSSGRKMSLYNFWEQLAPFYYYFRYGEKAFYDKSFCSFWYDGRR